MLKKKDIVLLQVKKFLYLPIHEKTENLKHL